MSQIEVCFCWATQLLEALLARCFCRGEGISGFELPTAEEALPAFREEGWSLPFAKEFILTHTTTRDAPIPGLCQRMYAEIRKNHLRLAHAQETPLL